MQLGCSLLELFQVLCCTCDSGWTDCCSHYFWRDAIFRVHFLLVYCLLERHPCQDLTATCLLTPRSPVNSPVLFRLNSKASTTGWSLSPGPLICSWDGGFYEWRSHPYNSNTGIGGDSTIGTWGSCGTEHAYSRGYISLEILPSGPSAYTS